jgi:hypothetical protein
VTFLTKKFAANAAEKKAGAARGEMNSEKREERVRAAMHRRASARDRVPVFRPDRERGRRNGRLREDRIREEAEAESRKRLTINDVREFDE